MRVGTASAALAGMLAAGLAQAQPAAPDETRMVHESLLAAPTGGR